jgi:hypothetical protein
VRKLKREDPQRYEKEVARFEEITGDPFRYEKREMTRLAAESTLYLDNIQRLLDRIRIADPNHPILVYSQSIDGPDDARTLIGNLSIIPEAALKRFFISNADECKRALAALTERCVQYRQEFVIAVKQQIGDGFLAPNTDLALVENRASHTLISIIDPLDEATTRLAGSWDGTGISVKPDIRPEREREIVFHEYVHAALAGRKLVVLENRPGYTDEIHEQKSGVQLRGRLDSPRQLKKWRWLNEALTEEIAARLGAYPPRVYENERHALKIVIRLAESKDGSGDALMQSLVYAYQEDYGSDVKGDSRLPRLQKALREVRAVAGDWLNSIERILK